MEIEKNQYIRALIVIFIAMISVVTIFFIAKTVNEIKASKYIGPTGPETGIISVSGEGEVFAIPDTAQFVFSVFEEAPTIESAQESVTKKQNEILSFLKSEGVDEEKIKTIGYNIFPRYEFRSDTRSNFPAPEGQRVLVGYEVRHTLEVKTKETDRVGEFIAGVTKLGANDVSGVSFTIEDEEVVRKEAREKAIEQARKKANDLAKDLGVALGPLVRFEEGFGGDKFYLERSAVTNESVGFDVAQAPSPGIPAGENKILVNVVLGYEIR